MKIQNAIGENLGTISEDVFRLVEDPFLIRTCPKCGREELKIYFRKELKEGEAKCFMTSRPLPPREEHLFIRCETCTYEWNAIPLDKQLEIYRKDQGKVELRP